MNLETFGQPATLEQDAIKAANAQDFRTFERRVIQLKALYQNNPKFVPTDATYMVMGLYLLFLLASDRIAEFHTELETISSHEQNNQFIKYPIQLERYIMEGNYAKVLVEKRNPVFDVLFHKLQGAVQEKQQRTRTESAASGIPTAAASAFDTAAALSVLSNMVGYATDLERIV